MGVVVRVVMSDVKRDLGVGSVGASILLECGRLRAC
jgi:hypothetical protein